MIKIVFLLALTTVCAAARLEAFVSQWTTSMNGGYEDESRNASYTKPASSALVNFITDHQSVTSPALLLSASPFNVEPLPPPAAGIGASFFMKPPNNTDPNVRALLAVAIGNITASIGHARVNGVTRRITNVGLASNVFVDFPVDKFTHVVAVVSYTGGVQFLSVGGKVLLNSSATAWATTNFPRVRVGGGNANNSVVIDNVSVFSTDMDDNMAAIVLLLSSGWKPPAVLPAPTPAPATKPAPTPAPPTPAPPTPTFPATTTPSPTPAATTRSTPMPVTFGTPARVPTPAPTPRSTTAMASTPAVTPGSTLPVTPEGSTATPAATPESSTLAPPTAPEPSPVPTPDPDVGPAATTTASTAPSATDPATTQPSPLSTRSPTPRPKPATSPIAATTQTTQTTTQTTGTVQQPNSTSPDKVLTVPEPAGTKDEQRGGGDGVVIGVIVGVVVAVLLLIGIVAAVVLAKRKKALAANKAVELESTAPRSEYASVSGAIGATGLYGAAPPLTSEYGSAPVMASEYDSPQSPLN